MANNLPSISILGCGWLGFPLAQHLISQDYLVKGSTTQNDKIALLSAAGIEPYQIQLTPEIVGNQVSDFLQSEVLFLNIPFKRNLKNPEDYFNQIEVVHKAVESTTVKHLVFAGSTSIYPANTTIAKESDIIQPDNPRSKVLHDVEQMLLTSKAFKTTILRFSGLYGGDRQLGRFIQHSRMKSRSGSNPVNLVHLDDCVQITSLVIQKAVADEVINVVSDCHPTRQELYTRKAEELGLESPEFSKSEGKTQKIVSNSKLKELLQYQFIHPDPMC